MIEAYLMTFENMVVQVHELIISQCKALINVIVDSLTEELSPTPVKKRTPNSHAGQVWMSDDFDDELPNSFWLGGDE
jgi:hypothetical protein